MSCPATVYGPTGHCRAGRHNKCVHGGAGVWLPECYVTIGRGENAPVARLAGQPPMAVISPSHRYRCPCDCHRVEAAA